MIFLKKKRNKKLFLGIDLGTTYSLVATVRKNNVIFLLDDKKRCLFPSIVSYEKNKILIGREVKKNITKNYSNNITSVKRLIGRSIDFIRHRFPTLPYIIKDNKKNGILLHTDYGFVTPIDISSEILKNLKQRAECFFNQKIHASIITVPAYFNNIQREATKKAALLSKIKLIRLLNEPTAAAIAYGLQKKTQGIIVVYDLGGGTFDLSILKVNKGIFEVLATGGDSNLGGDDFDILLSDYIYKKSNLLNTYNNFFRLSLLKIAKSIKLKLTYKNQVEVNFFNWKGSITRSEFNLTIRCLIERTLFICSNLLRELELSVEHIQDIIMVGGSTRIPFIHEQVAHFFNKKLLTSINPDQVVAMGAAIQANMLFNNSQNNKTVLLDVTPFSLGIEVMGGFVEKIIFRNTTIPTSKTKEFTTAKDNQTVILIHILQGEGELVNECISLSRFVLKDIPPKKSGIARILVTFQIDADGLINIKALERNSQKEKNIQIENNFFI